MKTQEEIQEIVESLRNDTVDVKPIDFDWWETPAWDEDGSENWTILQYLTCSECEERYQWHYDLEGEECPNCGSGTLEQDEGNEPMMNYYYPLPSNFPMGSYAAAMAISDLPLCLVYFEQEEKYALALTGGGMDFSWEICMAYVKLGYLPPIHFANLPKMAMHLGEDHLIVLAAFERALDIWQNWIDNDKRHLADLRQWYAERHTS